MVMSWTRRPRRHEEMVLSDFVMPTVAEAERLLEEARRGAESERSPK